MVVVLSELENITDIIKRFLVFLGPNLKAVTGNSEGIDNLVTEVKKLMIPYQNPNVNLFSKNYSHHWN